MSPFLFLGPPLLLSLPPTRNSTFYNSTVYLLKIPHSSISLLSINRSFLFLTPFFHYCKIKHEKTKMILKHVQCVSVNLCCYFTPPPPLLLLLLPPPHIYIPLFPLTECGYCMYILYCGSSNHHNNGSTAFDLSCLVAVF